ncbi:histidine kinase [Pedobacter sp. Du54]|uniref:sensor histidine kinase n=1 Tax=Pedobacter anseongensis TaxID=3133439 RepID=UPI0030A6D3CA
MQISIGFAQNDEVNKTKNKLSFADKYINFTVNDGLPSNNVYRVLEDNKGFLWVITDAGVARFDGKNFQRYTTEQGLPDNEVLYLEKEKNGRIWISTYKQAPAYFDETKNRFVTPLSEKMQRWFENTAQSVLSPQLNGEMMFTNRDRFFLFKDTKIKSYGNRIGKWWGTPIKIFKDGSTIVWNSEFVVSKSMQKVSLIYFKNNSRTDSLEIGLSKPSKSLRGHVHEGNVYIWNRNDNTCVVLSQIKVNPIRYKRDTITVPERYVDCFFTENSVHFTAYSGKIYVYNKKTLRLIGIFEGNFLPNSYGEDSKGNRYVCTIDKGLFVYRKNLLQNLTMPPDFSHTNFLSIAKRSDGTVFAGNYYGEIVEINKNGKFSLHHTNKIATAKIRKILFSGKDIYSFSEQGIYRNYKQRILIPRNQNISFAKTAIVYNDTSIIIGTHSGLVRLDTRTQSVHEMIPAPPNAIRITALVKAKEPFVYFGSTDGLYQYNFNTNQYITLHQIHPNLSARITALSYTDDGLVWVVTSDNKIVALRGDKVILNFNFNTISNHIIRNITKGKPGEIWVSTSGGVTLVRYHSKGDRINLTTQSLSVNNGLTSNEVQELFYQDGYIYAATSNGISVIPENYNVPKIAIPTFLVHITINGKEVNILNHYQLEYGKQNIQMQFAGVDLNGYFNRLQYQLDNNRWTTLGQNILNVQLRTGKHFLKIRAIDLNGNISNKILTLQFNVAIPIWQNIWFLLIGVIVFQLIMVYVISRYQKRKKEAKIAKRLATIQTAALEQQAFTSLMNPHFMFNALNSIQHYINVQDRQSANRYLSDFASLIRKNFEAAHQSFIPLEEEVENIQIYLRLEQMRFNEKFDYQIDISKDLDVEDWMIPTMILQPLLENAILHGIMPSQKPGKISILFTLNENDLLITITDNGIGIVNSKALKANNVHKSRGMELIHKRIKALCSFDTHPISIRMEEVFKNKRNPGNRILFQIPSELYKAWLNAKHS